MAHSHSSGLSHMDRFSQSITQRHEIPIHFLPFDCGCTLFSAKKLIALVEDHLFNQSYIHQRNSKYIEHCILLEVGSTVLHRIMVRKNLSRLNNLRTLSSNLLIYTKLYRMTRSLNIIKETKC